MDEITLEALSENPEIIDELSREQLDEARTLLVSAVTDYSTAVRDGTSDNPTEDLAAAREGAERLALVDARIEALDTDAAALAAEAVELLAGVAEVEEEPEAESEAESAAEAEEAPEAEVEEVEEPEAIAASRPSLSAMARRAPRLPDPEPALVASAGPMVHSQYPNGFSDPSELGAAALAQWRSYGSGAQDQTAVIASFDTASQYRYEVTGEQNHDAEVIDEMLAELRASYRTNDEPLSVLTASGGICAPSTPLYDFFSISEQAGMIELPTLAAPRGSITYPVSTSYASIRANVDWAAAAGNQHTNAEDIAGTSKPSFTVACPSTATCTVAAYTQILKFGNFAQRFYPEHVAHAMLETANFTAHQVNAALIAQMVAASTAVNGGDTGGGGLVNVANIIGFEAARYRDNYRMSPTAVLDLVGPSWVPDALVADLVARDSTQSFDNARARVLATFASLGVRAQWVQDWQSIGDAVAAASGWRQAADFMLFAPGTFVRLDEGRLDLGIVRDSTLNATNDFQTFTETFEAVCEIGHDSILLDDVTICPRGGTANRVTLDCNPGYNS